MCIVILGGNERMECRYREICTNYNCKAKIFTKMPGNFRRQIGSPDVMILFTNTISHKMVHSAVAEAAKSNTQVIRCHSSSACALKNVLDSIQTPA